MLSKKTCGQLKEITCNKHVFKLKRRHKTKTLRVKDVAVEQLKYLFSIGRRTEEDTWIRAQQGCAGNSV